MPSLIDIVLAVGICAVAWLVCVKEMEILDKKDKR